MVSFNKYLIRWHAFFCHLVHILNIIQVLAHHLGDELQPWQFSHLIGAYQLAIAKNGNMIAKLIYLLQEVGYKYNSHALLLQLPYNLEEPCCLTLIQRGGWLIQN